MITLSHILKSLRKEKNLSKTELAKEINAAPSAISSWEQGRRLPPSGSAAALGEYFGVSVDYLCGMSKRQSYMKNIVADDIDISKLNARGIEFLTDYYKYLLNKEEFTK